MRKILFLLFMLGLTMPIALKAETIEFVYPEIPSLHNYQIEEKIKNYFVQRKISFEEKIKDLLEEQKFYGKKDFSRYVFEEKAQITYHECDIIAFIVERYHYIGGAHPMSNKYGVAFDVHSGEKLNLADIIPNSNLEQMIYDATYQYINSEDQKHLLETVDLEVLQKVIAAANGDYNFYMNAEGEIYVVFNAYAIAPYSAGTIEVPLSVVGSYKNGCSCIVDNKKTWEK